MNLIEMLAKLTNHDLKKHSMIFFNIYIYIRSMYYYLGSNLSLAIYTIILWLKSNSPYIFNRDLVLTKIYIVQGLILTININYGLNSKKMYNYISTRA